MTTGSKLATATFLALAALSSLAPPANAAQCGRRPAASRPGRASSRARRGAKGVGATARRRPDADELCERDHRRRSQPAQLQPLARSVPRQARRLDHRLARPRAESIRKAALFASIQQRYGVPPGPLIAIWGMETAFGSQRGNQNMLSSIAIARLRLPPPGIFHRPALRGAKARSIAACSRQPPAAPCTARSARRSSCRRTSWPTAPAISTSPPTR